MDIYLRNFSQRDVICKMEKIHVFYRRKEAL